MPTVTERAAQGKAARAAVPRRSHAVWEPSPRRRDPVEMLDEQARSRVPELVPLRYERMLVSPFTFYRGGAYLMAADLATLPASGLDVQLCGDAHLSNFGAFAAPDRRLVFSVNDFDETLPGPFEWDVKRLFASFAVAGRHQGFDAARREEVLLTGVREYRQAMRDFAAMRTLDLWYLRVDVDAIAAQYSDEIDASARRNFERIVAKAEAKDNLRAFKKLVQVVDGQPRFVSDPPVLVPVEDLAGEDAEGIEALFREVMRSYKRTLTAERRRLVDRFSYAHAARKVVGVGSVGTRAWVLLMLGRDGEDPLFLQFKEAQPSVLEPFLGSSSYSNHGQRVVEGQRFMQAASDIMLGWTKSNGLDGIERHFYVRQLWDRKGSAVIEQMTPRSMTAYAHLCGRTLAKGHARSGDPVAIAGYLGRADAFDRAIATFAEAYADQNEADYRRFAAAKAPGGAPAPPVGSPARP
jgi:uncharacterized protein (DUF2252 family)